MCNNHATVARAAADPRLSISDSGATNPTGPTGTALAVLLTTTGAYTTGAYTAQYAGIGDAEAEAPVYHLYGSLVNGMRLLLRSGASANAMNERNVVRVDAPDFLVGATCVGVAMPDAGCQLVYTYISDFYLNGRPVRWKLVVGNSINAWSAVMAEDFTDNGRRFLFPPPLPPKVAPPKRKRGGATIAVAADGTPIPVSINYYGFLSYLNLRSSGAMPLTFGELLRADAHCPTATAFAAACAQIAHASMNEAKAKESRGNNVLINHTKQCNKKTGAVVQHAMYDKKMAELPVSALVSGGTGETALASTVHASQQSAAAVARKMLQVAYLEAVRVVVTAVDGASTAHSLSVMREGVCTTNYVWSRLNNKDQPPDGDETQKLKVLLAQAQSGMQLAEAATRTEPPLGADFPVEIRPMIARMAAEMRLRV